jgi:Spy/CpxP family protein refolding chaperone
MKKWKLALYLAAIFAAGFLSGGVVALKLVSQRFASFGRSGEGGPAALWVRELRQRLDLTPEQTKQITPIVTAATDDFIQTVIGHLSSSMEATNARILPLLTPVQREKFLQFTKEQEELIRRLSQSRLASPPPPSAPAP